MKKSTPILTSMVINKGKICVYTDKTVGERGQGYLIALDFIPKKSSEYTRLASQFLTRGDIQKYGGMKAIRNRILDAFARGNPGRDAEKRFTKALFTE